MKKRLRPKFEPVPVGIDYFDLPQTSNSDLSELREQTSVSIPNIDKEKAYSFGTLVDAVVTEQGIVNVFKNKIGNTEYSDIDFEIAKRMRDSFFQDNELREMYKHCTFQKAMIRNVPLAHLGVAFVMPMRCKWDFWLNDLWFGADLKSTAAATHEQFKSACSFFGYDRQRAFYMTIAGSDQDMLIGISKVNFKVFKLRIKRGDSFFNSGMSKFLPLAFKHHLMYG